MGINVDIQHVNNPRKEQENHYYYAENSGLLGLGLEPHHLTVGVLASMIKRVDMAKNSIVESVVLPRVTWANGLSC